MTTPTDTIRQAWQAGGFEALHRAAEELARQGHAESAIYGALEKLLLSQREAGADEATEDRITDVMERLTDWSREENRIRTAAPSAAPRSQAG